MTRRGAGAVTAVVALWAAARLLGVPQLQIAAVTLLALFAGTAAWVLLLPLRLEITRTVDPAEVAFGTGARVALLVRNLGTVPSPAAWLEDAVPPALGHAPVFRLPVLRPHGMIDLAVTLPGSHRGRFRIGPATVTVRDPFGLVQRRRPLPGTSVLTVLPPVWALPPGVPLGGATGTVRSGARRTTDRGEDLADIREYVRGDDLRAVHWASTAHRGRLMVRRAEESTAPRATVLLDIRASRHRGTGPRSSFEIAVATAASAAHHLGTRHRGVALLDRPTTGAAVPRPADAWLPFLAALEPEEVDLAALLRQISTGAAGEGTLVAVITPPDAQGRQQLVRAGRGAATRLAVVIDTGTFSGDATPHPEAEATVLGLRAAGWRATCLRAGEHLGDRWQELLGRGSRGGVA